MSSEGRLDCSEVDALAKILDGKWLHRHRFSPTEYMEQYCNLARLAAAKKLNGLREIAPSLFWLISDEKTLYTAFTHMEGVGSHSPGPDGQRYEIISVVGVWGWCRIFRDKIRKGEYTLSAERLQKIPKGSGRGYRVLVVQSIEDRIVHRAVVEVLQPLLDPLFDPRSFGYRPRKGPLRALATAEKLYRDHNLGAWVSVDIKNAFPSVPIGRLLGVIHKYLPDDKLLAFLETLIRPDKMSGLRQGSPLSPLLLNLHLHHLLDRKWRSLHPDIPLLRFADDILLLCKTRKKAREAYRNLVELLSPTGYALKESENDAIRMVSAGEQVNWMGFGIRGGPDGLQYLVTDESWDSLAEKFADAHERPNSPVAAFLSLMGWLRDKGPCFTHTDISSAYHRIKLMAGSEGFEEIPAHHEVFGYWQRAHARWCKLRKMAFKASGGACYEA